MDVIDMKAMRYINLLDKISRVQTRRCFIYNNAVYFAVNKNLVSRAIGPSAINIKKIQESIGARVKIIKEAEGIGDLKRFIGDVVSPIRPRDIELKENVVVITAGNNQNKASLIGRDKRRYGELKKIISDVFGKDLKIL
jgi:transcription antitermination factor NusA-like protein